MNLELWKDLVDLPSPQSVFVLKYFSSQEHVTLP